MKSEFLLAITQLAAERNLPKEAIFKAVEAALTSAYRKDEFGSKGNIVTRINPASGEVRVYARKTVVDTPTDPYCEISLAEAQMIKQDVQIGEVIAEEVTPPHAGRIAAQTAKQVVMQRLREAEREFLLGEFEAKEGELISGVVQRIDPRQIAIDLGKVEGILPAQEQVRGERYRVGQRLKLYLLEITKSSRGPRIVLSRTHPNLVRRLFELEIPEVRNGMVEIKAIAREPSSRTKVAVAALQVGIDPVGSCIGLRAIRIQNIVNELQGEKIDLIQWHPDPKVFIANALAPARVLHLEVDEQEEAATVIVPNGQLSLAIGKEGQNARLAAKLTGWKLDIKGASTTDLERAMREEAAPVERAVQEEVPSEELTDVAVEQLAEPPQEIEAEEQPGEMPIIRFAEDILPGAAKPDSKAKREKRGKTREPRDDTIAKRGGKRYTPPPKEEED